MGSQGSTSPVSRRPVLQAQHPSDKVLSSDEHKTEVFAQLRGLGVSNYRLLQTESRHLPLIIYHDETIGAVVYGHYPGGKAMLVATDRRVIFLDKKPLFIKSDEVNYDVVAGVSFNQAGVGSTLTLHTRVAEYTLRTLNIKLAREFRDFIEMRCLNQSDSRRIEQF